MKLTKPRGFSCLCLLSFFLQLWLQRLRSNPWPRVLDLHQQNNTLRQTIEPISQAKGPRHRNRERGCTVWKWPTSINALWAWNRKEWTRVHCVGLSKCDMYPMIRSTKRPQQSFHLPIEYWTPTCLSHIIASGIDKLLSIYLQIVFQFIFLCTTF